MILFSTPCIDHLFQDCTETEKGLFSGNSEIGKLWNGLTGLDEVFRSCLHTPVACVRPCETDLVHIFLFPSLHEESDQSSPTYCAIDTPQILHSLIYVWLPVYGLLQLFLDFEQLVATHSLDHL
jgi:hypothetical protein